MSFVETFGRGRGALCAVVVLGSAGGLASACGGGASNPGGAGAGGEGSTGGRTGTGGAISAGPLDEVDFAIRYAAAICDNTGACCKRANHAPPPSGCLTTIANGLSQQFAKYRQNLDYDRVAAGSCVAEVAAGVKACDVNAEVNAKSCRDVYRGKLVPGTRCGSGIECALPTGLAAQCSNGVCSVVEPPRPSAKEGESCRAVADASVFCEFGLMCDSDTNTCVTPGVAVGGDCLLNACKPGLTCSEFARTCRTGATEGYCYGGLGCALGSHFCDSCSLTCKPKLADGTPCQRFDECASGQCYPSGCGPELFGVVHERLCGDELDPPPIAPRACPTDAEPTDDFDWSEPVSIGSLGIVTNVWGTAANDIYASTGQGEFFHSVDGATWTEIAIPRVAHVGAFWGPNANEIYAGTLSGLFRGSAASTWVPVAIPAPLQLAAVSAVSGTLAGDLFVAGVTSNGVPKVLRRSGDAWMDLDLASGSITGLWPKDNGDLCAAGDQAFLRLGAGWLGYSFSSPNSLGGAGNVCYFSTAGGLHAIDAEGLIGRIPLLVDPNATVSSIWASGPDTVFVVVEAQFNAVDRGAIFQGDGSSTWTRIARLAEPRAIWGSSRDQLYVGTNYGVVRGARR